MPKIVYEEGPEYQLSTMTVYEEARSRPFKSKGVSKGGPFQKMFNECTVGSRFVEYALSVQPFLERETLGSRLHGHWREFSMLIHSHLR